MAQALYNVLRPVRFSEVIGQEAAATAVRRGLLKGEFEHSSIFYGQTGGGKTTMARIVGSYLNCEKPSDDGEPCCECDNCRALRDGSFADYVELNAATHGGKDDIDSLITNVSYLPQAGRAKVFVIDEAHCLTTSAWKSLLKVLEEPPSFVYFILCTTNFQAIPPEIQNRCGKYEFSAIGENEVYDYLKGVSGASRFSDDALMLVARQARGSMRDAVNSFSHIRMPYPEDYVIQVSDVEKYLNIITPETLATFIKACCQMDLAGALAVVSEAESSAMDITKLMSSILAESSVMITLLAGGKLPVGAMDVDASGVDLNRLVVVSNKLNEVYSKTTTRNYAALRLAVASVCCVVGGNGGVATADNSLLNALLSRISALESGAVKVTSPEPKVAEVVAEPVAKKEAGEVTGEDDIPSYDAYDAYLAMAEPEQETEPDEIASEEDNPLMAMFGVDAGDESFVESGEISREPEFIPSYDTEPVVGHMSVETTQPTTDAMDDEYDDNPFVSGGGIVGGIVFSDASLANQFKMASSKGAKADTALGTACRDDVVLNTLVNQLCDKKVTDGGVTLATPFAPVRDLLIAQLSYHKVTDVTVVAVDGLRI